MSLTFDPKAADAELTAHRRCKLVPADGGRWFDNEFDANGNQRCAMCGGSGGLVADHCHDTGLVRGLICYRCNSFEGFSDTPALNAWRLTAPGLTVGRREFYRAGYAGGEGLAHSTEDELLILPMDVLLDRAAIERRRSAPKASRGLMDFMAKALNGGGAA